MFKVFARIDSFENELFGLKNKLLVALENVHNRDEEIRSLRRQIDNMKIALDALNKVAYPDNKK